ncbi:MAG: nucleoside-diphosphate sugar epimerase/dehydratase [Oscillospiraceae bacterium]|nr:nucleoside-diphosphate sugar epimerase/dehydratase [Oscillospiraceae bacterium]
MTLVLLDIIMVNIVVLGAMWVRLEFSFRLLEESGFVEGYLKVAPVYTVVCLVIFTFFRLYRSLWEYASIDELRYIILAAVAAAAGGCVISNLMGVYLPRSLPVLNGVFLFLGLTGERYAYRVARRWRNRLSESRLRPTMLIGAGAGGAMALQELHTSSHSQNRVVCIIDDDPAKKGSLLKGVEVIGGREEILRAVERFGVTDIILAIPTASQKDKRDIIDICQKTSCRLQTLPSLYQLASGQVSVKQIRDVKVEDLLGRDKVQVNLGEIGAYIQGKTVLVTGGGGSIGSELCRQVARQQPRQLIIFDIYENNAYAIQQELKYRYPELDLVVLIGSVRDKERVEQVFDFYRPEIVCHAAAHKHVPLMEDSPNEAVKNNVFGTLNVAKMADTYGVESFVLISSDKAVNPTNVMGASKRICEMIVQVLSQHSRTRFVAVRFGNVLGSNGSVIPLFRSQIERGGPVTVTHRDIVRYFMTISEAVSLVLQACVYAKGGEVFVLDMGEPVRIDDLARKMIRLSGFEPDVDIPIVYTGLRPGEKLYEELLMQDEGLDKTPNELIFIGHFNDFDRERLIERLEELEEASRSNSDHIRDLIRQLVKTYHPAGEGAGV